MDTVGGHKEAQRWCELTTQEEQGYQLAVSQTKWYPIRSLRNQYELVRPKRRMCLKMFKMKIGRWYMSGVPVLRRQRQKQEDFESKASPLCIIRSGFNKNKGGKWKVET